MWRIRDRTLSLDRPLAAGIVNVTSDSFFSGARSGTPEQAIADGVALAESGFDMLDVGAVAARSGPPVAAEREAALLVPTVEGLAASGLPVSVDTFSVEVARQAIAAGAAIVNDISGGGDPAMYELAAETGCGLVIMHIEGPPRVERRPRDYDDVVAHLLDFFAERLETGRRLGVPVEQIALDPGFDFDLRVQDSARLLARLDELLVLGRPLFVALSRKDFLGAVLAGSWEERLPAEQREWATAAAVAVAVSRGARIFRLHDSSALDSMRVADRIVNG